MKAQGTKAKLLRTRFQMDIQIDYKNGKNAGIGVGKLI